jgi:hypothetical protein
MQIHAASLHSCNERVSAGGVENLREDLLLSVAPQIVLPVEVFGLSVQRRWSPTRVAGQKWGCGAGRRERPQITIKVWDGLELRYQFTTLIPTQNNSYHLPQVCYCLQNFHVNYWTLL